MKKRDIGYLKSIRKAEKLADIDAEMIGIWEQMHMEAHAADENFDCRPYTYTIQMMLYKHASTKLSDDPIAKGVHTGLMVEFLKSLNAAKMAQMPEGHEGMDYVFVEGVTGDETPEEFAAKVAKAKAEKIEFDKVFNSNLGPDGDVIEDPHDPDEDELSNSPQIPPQLAGEPDALYADRVGRWMDEQPTIDGKPDDDEKGE